jgi:predicted Zn finger-like uncharacterized protein
MTVECPSCNTRFPVDARKIPEGGVHARCSVCSEVFFVDVASPEVEAAPAAVPAEVPELVDSELPEAEVLEEEAAAGEEALEGEEEFPEPEPVVEAPEPVMEEEEEPEPVVQAWGAVEEDVGLEPEVEAPEPAMEEEEREPEPVVQAWGAVEEDVGLEPEVEAPEPAMEEEQEPEPVVEAWGVAVEESEPEARVESPQPVHDEPRHPFDLPPVAAEEPGSSPVEKEAPFEFPEIEREERTFGLEAPSFGDGETTFSMDSPAFDTPLEIDEEVAPTFGDPSPTIELAGFGVDDTLTPAEVEEAEAPEAEPPWEPLEPEVEEPPAATEAPEAPVMEPPPPVIETPEVAPTQPLPTPHFGRRDPKEKARRLARVLVSDIILYNPDRHQRALEFGNLQEEFEDEIQKSWNEYVDQVGEEVANSTNFFNEALNEILCKGEQLF